MSRLFFALDISPQVKKQLADWRSTQVDKPLINEPEKACHFKAIDENNFHITLCFIGEVSAKQQLILIEKASQLTQSLTPINPQTLIINEVGLFKKPKIVYLSNKVTPPWLLKLATALSSSASELALFQENRPYLPHISLYRKASYLPSLTIQPNIKLTIESFSLYQSISSTSGIKYQVIKSWNLT